MATGTLIQNDERFPYGLRVVDGVLTGERNYAVDVFDEDDALNATGVPGDGDVWSALRPDLRVRERATFHHGGVANEGEWTRVQVLYGTEAGGGGTIPEVGNDWTEITSQPAVVKVRETLEAEPRRIGDDGANKEIASIEFTVHHYVATQDYDDYPLDRVIELAMAGALNAEEVTLPNESRSGIDRIMPPESLKFRAFAANLVRAGLMEVVIVMGAAREIGIGDDGGPPNVSGWWVTWHKRNGQGDPVGDMQAGPIYELGDYSGLW